MTAAESAELIDHTRRLIRGLGEANVLGVSNTLNDLALALEVAVGRIKELENK